MKKGLILLLILLIGVCTILLVGFSEKEKTPDYTLETDPIHTAYVSFGLSDNYRGLAPEKDLSPQDFAKRQNEAVTNGKSIAQYEIYNNQELVFEFSFLTEPESLNPLLFAYETQYKRIKMHDELITNDSKKITVLEEYSDDFYEYIFYKQEQKKDPDDFIFAYFGRFKETDGLMFKAASRVSREEAEKHFKNMKVQFKEYSLKITNIQVDRDANRIEADCYLEGLTDCGHIVLDPVNTDFPEFSDFPENYCTPYQHKARNVLIEYYNSNSTETEISLRWK